MIGLFLDHKLTMKNVVVYNNLSFFYCAYNVSLIDDYAFIVPQGNT